MINFLKKFFKKEELLEEQVYSNDLMEWFERNTRELIDAENAKIRAVFDSIKQNQRELLVEAKKLGVADVKGNLMVKEYQIAEGSKEAFVKQISDFAKSTETPDMADYVFISEYANNFERNFNEFAKSTFKQFYIAQQFFRKNCDEISKVLKNLEKDLSNIKEIVSEKSNFTKIAKTRQAIKELLKTFAAKRKVKSMIEEEQRKLQDNLNYKKKIEDEKTSLENSEDHLKALALMQKKKDLEKQLSLIEANFISKVDSVGKLLKKFGDASVGELNLIADYLEKPYEAAKKDADFRILEIINKVLNGIENNKIHVEEKKKQKITEHLNSITKETLSRFKEDYSLVKSRIFDAGSSINNNTTLAKIEDIGYKLEHTESQINRITEEISKLNKYLEKAEDYKLKEIIEGAFRELLNQKITILMDDEP